MDRFPEQLNLEFEKVPVKVGDRLLCKKTDTGLSFINESGFETSPLPEGTLIETEAFMLMVGFNFPASRGEIHYIDGVAHFYPKISGNEKSDKNYQPVYKLWDNDVIKILELPNS